MSIIPVPDTPEAQRLWDRAMLIARTRGAYGCAFPVEGTTFKLPQQGTMLRDILFACTATDAEYKALLAAIREDMLQWKERVRASGGKSKLSIVRDLDVSKLEITL